MPASIESIVLAGRAARYLAGAAPEAAALSEQVFKDSLSDIFRHPGKLVDVLPELAAVFEKRGYLGSNLNLPEITRTLSGGSELGGLKVTRYLGSGESEFVLATEHNTAIKLSAERLPRVVPNPAFDAPVLSHGKIGTNYFYYQQPIANTTDVTEKHALDVIKKIRQNGYVDDDMWGTASVRRDQVGLFGPQRKPLLIDQRSALPRYGTIYENGGLIPHAEQQSNLSEISDYLQARKITLARTSVTAPTNPENYYDHVYSRSISDNRLRDGVIGHLETVGQLPTLSTRWTDNEIDLALRSMSLR